MLVTLFVQKTAYSTMCDCRFILFICLFTRLEFQCQTEREALPPHVTLGVFLSCEPPVLLLSDFNLDIVHNQCIGHHGNTFKQATNRWYRYGFPLCTHSTDFNKSSCGICVCNKGSYFNFPWCKFFYLF